MTTIADQSPAAQDNPKVQRTLRVAAVQFESVPGDKEANFRTIEAFVKQAAARGVRLIIFPECCITGYWFIRNLSVGQLAALAEPVPDGPSTRPLSDLDASLLAAATGRKWIRARRPDLYSLLTIPTGLECDTRTLKFEE